MKLRISKELLERLRSCADAVDATLSEYVWRCAAAVRSGKLRVANSQADATATRDGSTVITVDVDCGMPPDELRRAIAAGIEYAEQHNPEPFVCQFREGVDYILGAEHERKS